MIQTNLSNLSQKTNILAGSTELQIGTLYLQNMSIPGISFSHPEIGGRGGFKGTLNADTVEFNTLNFDVLVDENFEVYNDLISTIFKQIDLETYQYSVESFDFWISVTDNFGNPIAKWDYFNCKIESISDLDYSYSDETTEYTMNMSLRYDSFKFTHFKHPRGLPHLVV